MNPISITPIRVNLPKKIGILTNHAQTVLKPQIKGVSVALEKFFAEVKPEVISQKEQKLRNIGIKQIGNSTKDGIIFSGDECDYHIFTEENTLNLNTLKPDSNEAYKHFSINSNSDAYYHAGDYSGNNIEDEISEVLDLINYKLLKAKTECMSAPPRPFIPDSMTSEKLAKLNRILRKCERGINIKNIAFIDPTKKELITSVIQKFKTVQELLLTIKDRKTQYLLRSSYNNYMPASGTSRIGFKNIGPNSENISLYLTSFKKDKYVALKVINSKGKEYNFVISENLGTVQRNFPYKYEKFNNTKLKTIPNFYTQIEIDNSDMYSYLSCLDKELPDFTKHVQNWFNKKEELKIIRSNHDAADLEQYKELMDDIYTNYIQYRKKIRTFLHKSDKSKKFKLENGISTKITSKSTKFKNITPEGYDLRLSYPKVHDKLATQLLVMDGDKIEKSFYILDNRLLRFNIKDLNTKLNHDRKLYYYDNKYLQESNLHDYLLILKDKLQELNAKLDEIRAKQIENKIRLKSTSPKEELELKK